MKNISQKYNTKLATFISLLVTLILFFPYHLAGAQTLKIYHIDVEQADATLVISPSGKTLLIDSGKNGYGSRIKAVMKTAGLSRIDHFVCTHYHEDHYGGIDDLWISQIIYAHALFLDPEERRVGELQRPVLTS